MIHSSMSFRSYGLLVWLAMACAGLILPSIALAQAGPEAAPEVAAPAEAAVDLPQQVRDAWAALSRADYPAVNRAFEAGLKAYEAEAMKQHSALTAFPSRAEVERYQVMNDVAVLHFIQVESLRSQGKTDDALATAGKVVREYPFSQAWDASRGGYWSIAEKSQMVIDQITGVEEKREEAARNAPLTVPKLFKPGKEKIIDYTKYGRFTGIGTTDYRYEMGNPRLLSLAVGQGIYPNTGDILKDPAYRKLYREGRLKGTHWEYVNTRDREAAFYKWATAPEHPGIKLFYTALILERSKMYIEALRAYHAVIVHFPKTSGMTYWQTPWYPAQAAIGKIKNILRFHPELKLQLVGAKVRVINGSDNDLSNDVFVVSPGVITKKSDKTEPFPYGHIKRRVGGKKVYFAQYENQHWKMFIDGKPYFIKGITYTPTKVGQSPDKGTLENWMFQPEDSAHKAWVDKNRNNAQDIDEPSVGDFQLLKEMGVNTLRIYNNQKINKELLRELFEKYGIRVIIGDFIGKYAIGSGAEYNKGTDYENPEHLANMMKHVEETVRDLKDEPYVLMWLLGNENNYGVASNADKKPDAYYKFVNEVAKKVKEIDGDRPVALCNGDILFVDKVAKLAPEIDAFGGNVYRGDYGFGSFWDEVREIADRPAFITEFGAPAYSKVAHLDEAEEEQAAYHKGNWLDIMANSAGHADGAGNAVGGIVFEWLDEWWKNYEPAKHDTKADVIGPFGGGYYFEEWFGLAGQGDGKNSPLMRQLRKSYFTYKELWNNVE